MRLKIKLRKLKVCYRIEEFTELKAYVDILNERGHSGLKEAINPFFWWNYKWPGKIDENVHAFMDEGLVVVLETDGKNSVKNMLVFALCPQKSVLKKILTITKNYDTVVYNSEFRDRYRNITMRLDGATWLSNGRHYYAANGGIAWSQLYGSQ